MSDSTVGPSRRSFVIGTTSGALGLGLWGCNERNRGPVDPPRQQADETVQAAPESTSPPFEFDEWTIAALASAMAKGELSSRALTESYLERTEALNRNGPHLAAVIETNPNALAIAEQLDCERAEKKLRGPLHGIPIYIKDNIATADSMETTAGSLALVGFKPLRDSFIVAQLRQAGAVILGKSNLSEWANMRSTHSTSGWSARGGLCRSPYVLDRNPCGSSSGSAVAVAANMCAVAVGTETDGSIVCPASHNGLVGIKPTVGAVSRTGIIPISASQDTAGPMARTVADAAVLLGAMVGVDARDSSTNQQSPSARSLDYAAALATGGLHGARIGVARNLFGFHSGVDALIEKALQTLSEGGAVIIDKLTVPNDEVLGAAELEVLLFELKAGMAAYLKELSPQSPKTLADLIAFNKKHADQELALFGQELFEMAEARGSLKSAAYQKALATLHQGARTRGLDPIFRRHRLDAVVAPTNGPAWVTDTAVGDHYLGGSSSAAATAGYPNITVPAGQFRGLPIGISFFGKAWSEATLIRIAFDFEQRTLHRRKPAFIPSLERPAKN